MKKDMGKYERIINILEVNLDVKAKLKTIFSPFQ